MSETLIERKRVKVRSVGFWRSGDRSLVSVFLAKVIAEEGTVPFPFPADVEIKGDPCVRLSRGDRVVHAPYRYRSLR